jgi:tripartite-type tricarboxylate transporter receptor subunit TctC
MKRLITFAGLAAFALASGAAWSQAAAPYPSKPIRLITPFAPGATTDALSRIIGQKMQESWGQNVLVDNRAGATGMVGTDLAAKSPPDGYTFVNVISTHVLHKHLFAKVPFDPIKDFEPVILLARVTNVLIVHPSVPAHNVKEFIAFAKEKQGKLVYATSGTGSSNHLSAEMFKQAAGIQMEHVPYKGGAPAVNDLIGGQVPVMMASLLTGAPHVRSGRARGILVTSAKRQSILPDVPTLKESGFPTFEADEWWAILAPAGTPKEIVNKVNLEIVRIFQLPDVKERIANLGIEYIGSTPDGLAKFMRNEAVKWEKVIKTAGIKAEG